MILRKLLEIVSLALNIQYIQVLNHPLAVITKSQNTKTEGDQSEKFIEVEEKQKEKRPNEFFDPLGAFNYENLQIKII